MLYERVIPASVDAVVVALCADYKRRARAIKSRSVSHRCEMEFKYLNYRILEGAMELVGDDAEELIRDIGEKIGYARSSLDSYSETTYKNRKKEVKINIAKKLHLID